MKIGSRPSVDQDGSVEDCFHLEGKNKLMYVLTRSEIDAAIKTAEELGDQPIIRGDHLPPPAVSREKLSFSEVSSTFCDTGRSMYLARVKKEVALTNDDLVRGGIEHAAVAISFKELKMAQQGIQSFEEAEARLSELARSEDELNAALWNENALGNVQKLCEQEGLAYADTSRDYITAAREIIKYELHRFGLMLSSDNYVIPTIKDVESYIDGSVLGLGKGRIDAALMLRDDTIVVCDLKKKPYKDNLDSKTQIAGYALALEKAHKVSVSVGCLVFSQPTMCGIDSEPSRELFPLDEELRQEFLRRTRRAIEVVSGDELPPIVTQRWKCKKCAYSYYCHPGSSKGLKMRPTE